MGQTAHSPRDPTLPSDRSDPALGPRFPHPHKDTHSNATTAVVARSPRGGGTGSAGTAAAPVREGPPRHLAPLGRVLLRQRPLRRPGATPRHALPRPTTPGQPHVPPAGSPAATAPGNRSQAPLPGSASPAPPDVVPAHVRWPGGGGPAHALRAPPLRFLLNRSAALATPLNLGPAPPAGFVSPRPHTGSPWPGPAPPTWPRPVLRPDPTSTSLLSAPAQSAVC